MRCSLIPKNLKPGDTFEDGGRTFVVDDICAVGYISHLIDKPVKEPVKEPAKEPAKRKRRTAE